MEDIVDTVRVSCSQYAPLILVCPPFSVLVRTRVTESSMDAGGRRGVPFIVPLDEHVAIQAWQGGRARVASTTSVRFDLVVHALQRVRGLDLAQWWNGMPRSPRRSALASSRMSATSECHRVSIRVTS